MKEFKDFDGCQYELLDHEIEKREQRKELKDMMAEYLASGGKIKRVGVTGAPKPKFKYLNRKQRQTRSESEPCS